MTLRLQIFLSYLVQRSAYTRSAQWASVANKADADVSVDNSTSEITEQQRCRDLGFCTALTSLIFVVTWHDIIAFTNTGHTNLTVS